MEKMESKEPFRPVREDELFSLARAGSSDLSIVIPVPTDTPEPTFRHATLGKADDQWSYKDHDGKILGWVCRFDRPDGKQVLPCTLWQAKDGELMWRWKQWPGNRPLYGLDRLSSQTDAAVLIVEGEKCAYAAAEAFPSWVVVTSSGGSDAAGNSDWLPLSGRDVVIWPDADESGRTYAASVATQIEATAETIRIVDPYLLAKNRPSLSKACPRDTMLLTLSKTGGQR